MQKIQEGDTVRLIDPSWSWGKARCGDKADVGHVSMSNSIRIRFDNGEEWWANTSQIELVTKQGEHEMSDVKNSPNYALKNLNTDADTRLLRAVGFEDEQGAPTSDALTELRRRAWATSRAAIAADLRTALANEKTDVEPTPAVK